MREIFVFGSNLQGRHGKGAALFARENHGAIYGQAEGLQGNSYAIPTKSTPYRSLPLEKVLEGIARFKQFALEHPELLFKVTPIGCGLAGFTPEQIRPAFNDFPENCLLPGEFTS